MKVVTKLIILFVLLCIVGCSGAVAKFNVLLEEMPDGGFSEFTLNENIAPSAFYLFASSPMV